MARGRRGGTRVTRRKASASEAESDAPAPAPANDSSDDDDVPISQLQVPETRDALIRRRTDYKHARAAEPVAAALALL